MLLISVFKSEQVEVSSTAEPVGTIEVALAHAARLLPTRPELAMEQVLEILKVDPRHPQARLLRGRACRVMQQLQASDAVLRELVADEPNWPAGHYELGLTLGLAGQSEAAVASLRRAVALKPDMPDAWRALGDQLIIAGRSAGCRLRLRAAHQGVDPRPAAAGGGRGPVRERDSAG